MDKELSYEAKMQPFANQFYLNNGIADSLECIERSPFKTITGRYLQRKDIDLIIENKNTSAITISEKFRKNGYNNVFIEGWEFNENGESTGGWAVKCEADFIMIFDQKHHSVKCYLGEVIKELTNIIINNSDMKQWIDKFHENKFIKKQLGVRGTDNIDIEINGQRINIFLFWDDSFRKDKITNKIISKWTNICYAINLEDFKNIFGYNYKEFNNFYTE